ncbi:hypothetical protein J6590_004321 [Homalodisca vitripennis]|nr:hypothetical protein J6590_004321 [Homalodisca vitripennis]
MHLEFSAAKILKMFRTTAACRQIKLASDIKTGLVINNSQRLQQQTRPHSRIIDVLCSRRSDDRRKYKYSRKSPLSKMVFEIG